MEKLETDNSVMWCDVMWCNMHNAEPKNQQRDKE